MTDNPATVDDYRMSRICAHIEAFVDALQIRRCVVVGQSRGGFVAAHLTKARPELVERLVIINSASFAPKRAAKRKVTLENFKGLPATVESDERWLSVGTGHITEDWLRESTAMLELSKSWEAVEGFRQASEAYYAEMEALKADLLQWYRSGASAIDSLVVWGVGDPAVSLQDGLDCFEVLSAGSGRTRMYVMDGAGHHCFAERPEEFGSVLRLYLALDSSLLEPSK
jgi:pimeloyl-ACP methyl ester carboxylesterase